ncbi:MAG: MerR family transcriptional regulator [Bacteroidetes bacterium]|nr:MerR family transcriptional regulator [Bacteroidota bacterium]
MEDIEKRYYTIAEAAATLGVNASVLRFWEKEFGTISSRKTSSGRRLYTREDLERLKNIHFLLKVRKFTLKGAREALRQQGGALTQHREMLETLEELRDFLRSIRESL